MTSLVIVVMCGLASTVTSLFIGMWLWKKFNPRNQNTGPSEEVLRCLGVDLGSHTTTVYSNVNGKLVEVMSERSCVSFDGNGRITCFDIESVLQNIHTSFASVLESLVLGSGTTNGVSLGGDYNFSSVGALCVLIQNILLADMSKSRKSRSVLMTIALPPYVPFPVVANLYSACSSTTGLNKLLVVDHGAAIAAAYMKARNQQHPPHLVAADFGYLGLVLYFIEFDNANLNAVVAKRVVRFGCGCRAIDEFISKRLCVARSAEMFHRSLEAAADLRKELSNIPGYLATTYRDQEVTTNLLPGTELTMSAQTLKETIEPVRSMLEEALREMHSYIRDRNLRARNIPCLLLGSGFGLLDLKHPFEKLFSEAIEQRHAVAQGLAIIGAMHEKKYRGPHYNISPLYVVPNVPTSYTTKRMETKSPPRSPRGSPRSPISKELILNA